MVFVLGGCGAPAVKKQTAVAVKLGQAQVRDVPVEVKATGHVEAYNTVNIMPRVTGKLVEIRFAPGEMVARDQIIAVIDTLPFSLAVTQAQSEVDKLQAQLDYAALEYDRKQPLLAQGAITSEDLSQLKSQNDYAVANLVQAKAALEQAQINLGYCYIRSPLAGRMGDRLVDNGNIVTQDTTTVAVVNQYQPVYVRFNAPERYLNQVTAAIAKGSITVDAINDKGSKIATGKLVFVNNAVDKSVGTIELKGQFINADNALYPGEYVQAAAVVDTLKGAMTVPISALQPLNDGGVLFTVGPDSKAKLHNVKIVQYNVDYVVISGDIKNGDAIVTDGQLNLTDGALVATK